MVPDQIHPLLLFLEILIAYYYNYYFNTKNYLFHKTWWSTMDNGCKHITRSLKMLDLVAHYGCGDHICKHIRINNSENMMKMMIMYFPVKCDEA
jgi:hypothetical protein